MTEIYWITRFGTISHISEIVLVISLILLIVASFIYLINVDDNFDYEKKVREICKKILKCDLACLIISGILFIFVPTTKEALLIWGVGGTVDYIKNNPTAKQLPDKCINALDKWVDNLSLENDSIGS